MDHPINKAENGGENMILACTKQLLDELGLNAEKVDTEFDPMYVWVANMIRINRRKTLVAVHAASRIVFVLYGITAKHKKLLPQLIKEGIRTLLKSEKIKPEIIEAYLEGFGGGVLIKANAVRKYVNYCNFACKMVQEYAQSFQEDDLYQTELLPRMNAIPLANKEYRCAYESLADCFAQRFGENLYSICMLELEVTLNLRTDCRRILRVPDTLNFAELHQVLQAAFGWHNCHLHEFVLETDQDGRTSYVVAPYDDMDDIRDVRRLDPEETSVDDILNQYETITYMYDFGDGWEHTVRLINITEEDGKPYPQCISAVGDAPVEDSGGPGGFAEIMDILQNPNHPEYQQIREWVHWQYWHPLDIEWMNRRLRHVLRDT